MSGITETTRTVPVFTVDGVDFTSRAAAEQYIKDQTAHRYFTVTVRHPRFTGDTIFAVRTRSGGEDGWNAAFEHCHTTFGPVVADVDGRATVMWSFEPAPFATRREAEATIAAERPGASIVYVDGFGKVAGVVEL